MPTILLGLTRCSGQFLTCTKIKARVLSHQELPKTDNRVCQVELLPESIVQLFLRTLLPRNPLPREHSLRKLLSRARRTQQPTSLISAYIHGVHYVARSSHISNVTTTPTSAQTVIEGSRNHSCNQRHNPGRYEGIATCRPYGY